MTEKQRLAKEALDLITRVKARDGKLTDSEQARLKAIDARMGELDNDPTGLEAEHQKAAALVNSMFGGTYKASESGGTGGHLSFRLSREGVKSALSTSRGVGIKALIVDGSSIAPVSLDANIVAEGKPATSLLDLLPIIREDSSAYRYLRQTTRTNAAAPVARGALKPESKYSLTPVDGRLKIIAHVSEPIHEFDLSDFSNLETFLRDKMLYGLHLAMVTQALNGDGTGESFTGFNSVSGTLTQAFSGDVLTTLRKALTALELNGQTPSGIVMSPSDWEAIELLREDGATGGFMLSGGPVDVAKRRLWGVPVAATSAVPNGTAWVLSEGSAHLRLDANAPGAVLAWGRVGDDFQRNQVRARAELRADLSVEKPGGIVKVSLTA